MTSGLQNHLLSSNKFTEEKYVQVFDNKEVNIYDANDLEIQATRGAVLKGWKVPKKGLWRFPIVDGVTRHRNQNTTTAILKQFPQEVLRSPPPATKDVVNNVYELKTKPYLIRYYHAAAGFPTKPSWLAAIGKEHYLLWPGLDGTSAAKHFPESEETWRGHGRMIKSGLRSTKQLVTEEEKETAAASVPNEQAIVVQCFDLKNKADRIMFSDQTGRFPVTSYRGNQYIMVLFEIASNNILVEPMQSRVSGEMCRAYQILVDRLKERGIKPTMHVLDNECSAEFKSLINGNEM